MVFFPYAVVPYLRAMDNFPNLINSDSKEILERRGFEYLGHSSMGMYGHWTFENHTFRFILAVDRGYFEAQLTPQAGPKDAPADLIRLLRTIKKDNSFYQYRLDEVGRSNTLCPNEYVQLLDAHYADIQHYFEH